MNTQQSVYVSQRCPACNYYGSEAYIIADHGTYILCECAQCHKPFKCHRPFVDRISC